MFFASREGAKTPRFFLCGLGGLARDIMIGKKL
jgi:hypothetical protein